jgi:hypothetical protein
MSRYLEYDEKKGKFTEYIDSMDQCRNMYDDACCCFESEKIGDFPDEEYYHEQCPFFEKEDGILCED